MIKKIIILIFLQLSIITIWLRYIYKHFQINQETLYLFIQIGISCFLLTVFHKAITRVAEVKSRFFLDALPKKQMMIDSDLNAGTITTEEARKKRKVINKEADETETMSGLIVMIKRMMFINLTVIGLIVGYYLATVQSLDNILQIVNSAFLEINVSYLLANIFGYYVFSRVKTSVTK